MPQVDLETLVAACAGGGCNDRKIACETIADNNPPDDDFISDAVHVPSDFPPESFWLSKDAEYDWFDRNAFLERNESTKANNSNPTNPNSFSNPNPNQNLANQRNSLNVKSMIGLPKTQKATFEDTKRRTCKPANIRLFPKRFASIGKSTGPMVEPGSPKVSCMGRVRSKRGRRRSNSLKRSENPMDNSKTGIEKQKTGFYSKVMSLFRSGKGRSKQVRSGSRKVAEDKPAPSLVEPQRKSVSAGGETPGLGGMQRFSSGRRSGSWTAEDFSQGDSDRRVGVFGRS